MIESEIREQQRNIRMFTSLSPLFLGEGLQNQKIVFYLNIRIFTGTKNPQRFGFLVVVLFFFFLRNQCFLPVSALLTFRARSLFIMVDCPIHFGVLSIILGHGLPAAHAPVVLLKLSPDVATCFLQAESPLVENLFQISQQFKSKFLILHTF